MSLLLNNAISGLLTAQRGMDTTSHNIANVNTDGYSRQRVDQAARIPQYLGGSFVGTGVEVTELRAGVYVFFDLVQAGLGVCGVDDIALSVLATVVSHHRPGRRLLRWNRNSRPVDRCRRSGEA